MDVKDDPNSSIDSVLPSFLLLYLLPSLLAFGTYYLSRRLVLQDDSLSRRRDRIGGCRGLMGGREGGKEGGEEAI